jgi:CO/xanthine dehydrogenase Mo-binding subunit
LRPTETPRPATIGASAPRLEDHRLVRAEGRFVDDVDLAGQLTMRVVRADVAHARIRGIGTDAARAIPGVVDVITAADLDGLEPIPLRLDFGIDLGPHLQHVLALERVRYVGEPVAAVVAEDGYLAHDAADRIAVDYEELPVVLDAREALAAGAPTLWEGRDNEAARLHKRFGDVERAFAEADRVVRAELATGRHTGMPLETRGLVAEWDDGRGHLTVWGAALVTHYHRRVLSRLLGIPVGRISMRPTDAGGNFGVRGDFFPEDLLVPFLAIRTRRPVKWTEDRAEHFVATNHAREQVHRIEGAFSADGGLLALRDEVWHNKGAYIRPTGVVVSEISVGMLPWPYRVPAYEGTIHVVTTNKTPVGPYRAPGRFEGTFAREQLLSLAAAELGLDPVELRRRNLITCDELPYEPDHTIGGEPFALTSGDFRGLLAKAVEAASFDEWRREAAELRGQGRLVGTGIGYFMDKSGLGVYETAGIDVDADGTVRVLTGGSSSGQGIETVLGQIAGENLGVPLDRIEVVHGDTDLIPDGVGSWSSRTTVIGGSAVLLAARETAEKARRIAADMLEAAVDDVMLEDGRLFVAGSPGRGLSLAEVAAAADTVGNHARGEEPGLGARTIYVDPAMNYPYGVGLGQIEIDEETGSVHLRRYFVGYEIGRAVNPMLVKGQIAGGAAQGLGGALMEELTYDPSGQPTATSFMDYLVPGAAEMPPVGVLICEDAPTPTNPLGAKGAGESGIMPVGAVVASGVEDALGAPGLVTRLPVHPERVLAWIAQARTTPQVRRPRDERRPARYSRTTR